MKTPREILLEQHKGTRPKLDDIRHAVVEKALNPNPKALDAKAEVLPAILRTIRVCWQQLVLPSRRIWIGLASVWLAIGVVRIAARLDSPALSGPRPVASEIAAAQVQQKLLNELLADLSVPSNAKQ